MFNFGENWQEYSKKTLNQERFETAVSDLEKLIGKKNLLKKTFLDIGCGSGIHALAASKLGAKKITGIDISKESIQISKINKNRFLPNSQIKFLQKSILEINPKKWEKFDVVYSWGVLHHTGDMYKSIELSSNLVKDKGKLVLAIYNKHWSSHVWWYIKKFYNHLPKLGKRLMEIIFFFIIALAKFMVTFKNPFIKKRRGMSFYFDLIDWLGGFPYEYANKEEIKKFLKLRGFKLIKFVPSHVPTGCHEYIFVKTI